MKKNITDTKDIVVEGLDYPQIVMLHNALANEKLASKHLSSDNFFSLMCLKKKLRDFVVEFQQFQSELATAYSAKFEDLGNGAGRFVCDDEEFHTKLRAAQSKKQFVIPELYFISDKEELRKFVIEADTETQSILFEYLLKKAS